MAISIGKRNSFSVDETHFNVATNTLQARMAVETNDMGSFKVGGVYAIL